jgi:hypothetical protein
MKDMRKFEKFPGVRRARFVEPLPADGEHQQFHNINSIS